MKCFDLCKSQNRFRRLDLFSKRLKNGKAQKRLKPTNDRPKKKTTNLSFSAVEMIEAWNFGRVFRSVQGYRVKDQIPHISRAAPALESYDISNQITCNQSVLRLVRTPSFKYEWIMNDGPNDDEFGTFIYLFIVIIIISVLMLLLCLCVFFFRGKFQTHSELSHLIR